MRVLRRRRNLPDTDVPETEHGVLADEPEALERLRQREPVTHRWTPGSFLVVLAGSVLAVIGIIALTRSEINETWYRPVVHVADIDHTPLLAAIEVGVGVLIALLALLGARTLTALVSMTLAAAAVIAAVDAEQWSRELAIERWWAVTLAVGGALAALVVMTPWPTTAQRLRTPMGRRRPYGRPIEQQ